MIEVQRVSDTKFEVTVKSGSTTQHTVTVSDDYHQELTGGAVSKEDLLKRSFEFLLEREPNTAILRTFDLPVISNYFPEYEQTIKAG